MEYLRCRRFATSVIVAAAMIACGRAATAGGAIDEKKLPASLEDAARPAASGPVRVTKNGAVDITLRPDTVPAPGATFDIATPPQYGMLSNFDDKKGTVTYTPRREYEGSDTFVFTVSGRNEATPVRVEVLAAVQWTAEGGQHKYRPVTAAPDGALYVFPRKRLITALSTTGKVKWSIKEPKFCDFLGFGKNGTVYMEGSKEVVAVNPDGSIRWRCSTGEYLREGAVAPDGTLFAQGRKGSFFAVSPDGKLKWKKEELVPDGDAGPAAGPDGGVYVVGLTKLHAFGPDGREKWSFDYQNYAERGAVVKPDGTVLFGIGSTMYALDGEGRKLWEHSRSFWGPVLGKDGAIYVGDCDELFALGPDGKEKWKMPAKNGRESMPMIGADGTLYFPTGDNIVHAVAPDGKEKWRFSLETPAFWPGAFGEDGTLYFSTKGEMIYALNPDGTMKWGYETEFDTGSRIVRGPDGAIYVATEDDKVCMLRVYGRSAGAKGIFEKPKWTFGGGTRPPGTPFLRWAWEGGSVLLGEDGSLYMRGERFQVRAPDGTVKWEASHMGGGLSLGADGTLFLAIQDSVWARRTDGTVKWRYGDGDFQRKGVAIGSDGAIYAGTLDGQIHAVGPDGKTRWTYQADTRVCAGPVIGSSGTIYAVAYGVEGRKHTESKLHAVTPDGKVKWTAPVESYAYVMPAVGPGDSVYVPCYKFLVAIDGDGNRMWTFPLKEDHQYCTPAIGEDGTVYQPTEECLYALYPDGSLKWRFKAPLCYAPAIGSKGTIYVGGKDGRLYAVNPDGTLKWSYRTKGDVDAPSIGPDGTVYASSGDGKLYAFYDGETLAKSPWPMYAHDPRHTARSVSTALSITGVKDTARDGVEWIIFKDRFVARKEKGKLKTFREFMEVRNFEFITVNGLAFDKDHVWAATDRGAFCYDRKAGGWTEYAVNRTHIGFAVDSVAVEDDSVILKMKVDGEDKTYVFDTKKSSWSER